MNSDRETKQALEVLDIYGLPLHDSSFFWVRYPVRSVIEIYKMSENTNSILNVFPDVGKLVWDEVITNNFENDFLISIEADSSFPFNMPKVFVKEPYIEFHEDKHMYSDDRRLCLMHPDAYDSQMSILEFRNMASSWCFCIDIYNETSTWPAAAHPHENNESNERR